MAITHVGSDSGQEAANTTSITLTLPSHSTDDFGIIFGHADENGTISVLDVATSGWTELYQYDDTTDRDRVVACWYKMFTSGSETNPVMSTDTSEEHSAILHVFRGVDISSPFDTVAQYTHTQTINNTATPTIPPITTLTDSACIVLHCAMSHDDLDAIGSPSGYTDGETTATGRSTDHRQGTSAYDLDVGTAGAKLASTTWNHTVTGGSTGGSSCFSIALREAQPVGVTDVNTDEQIDLGEQNNVATGYGFEATQNSGKLEVWSDQAGTIKVTQTIDSWSATSIQFDFVQSTLSEGTNYVVVTNDSSEESLPFQINVGLPPYDDVISAMSPSHWWQLDNTYDDEDTVDPEDMVTDIVGTHSFPTTPICELNTYAWQIDDVLDRRGCGDNTTMNSGTSQERTMGGWIELGDIQQSLGSIYKEGGQVNNLCFLTGFGNTLLAQLTDSGDDQVQTYSDFKLAVDRPYHIMFRFSYDESTNEFHLFIDGVMQGVSNGNPLLATNFDGHSGDINWGDPDNNLDMGGTDIAFAGKSLCRYAQWATWYSYLDATTDIKEKLFERGVLPDDTISADTEANMQTDLETYADAERPDWPLSFRIEASTSGTFKLIADNITFNDRVSLQIQYMGTATLTWVNAGTSNLIASKVSNPSGGTVTIVETAPITFTVTNTSGNVIPGARIALYKDSDSSEIFNTTTDENGQISYIRFEYTSSTDVFFRVRRSSNPVTFHSNDDVADGTEIITPNEIPYFNDGEDVVYSREGGTADIGPEPGTYYAGNVTGTTLMLYDTAVNAIAGGATGKQDLTGTGTETHSLTPKRYIKVSGTGTIESTGLNIAVILSEDTNVE